MKNLLDTPPICGKSCTSVGGTEAAYLEDLKDPIVETFQGEEEANQPSSSLEVTVVERLDRIITKVLSGDLVVTSVGRHTMKVFYPISSTTYSLWLANESTYGCLYARGEGESPEELEDNVVYDKFRPSSHLQKELRDFVESHPATLEYRREVEEEERLHMETMYLL